MKTLFQKTFILLLITLLITSCSDKNEVTTTPDETKSVVKPVEELYTPSAEEGIVLSSSAASEVTFKWKKSAIEGKATVKYAVLFDKEGGDFSKPIRRVTSNQSNTQSNLNISHAVLDEIWSEAGFKQGETGSLIWTVVSITETSEILAITFSKLTIIRLTKTLEIPEKLFLLGDATEAGVAINDALEFRRISTGQFEIFTKLTNALTYKLINNKAESDVSTFFVEDGKIRMGDVGSSVNKTAVYRMTADFTKGTVTFKEIDSFGLFFCIQQREIVDLEYKGKGVWSGTGYLTVDQGYSWGNESRYKFQMKLRQNNYSTITHWGQKIGSNGQYMAEEPVDQWGQVWAFSNEQNKTNSTVTVSLSGEEYSHSIQPITLSANHWQSAADASTMSLLNTFWNNSKSCFNDNLLGYVGEYNYWPQAHSLDVLVDAYIRTNNDVYKQRIANFHEGVKRNNRGSFWNAYFDDMAWHGLAHLRAFEATADTRYEKSAKDLWLWIVKGWDETDGGGIKWNSEGGNGKAVPTNGPSTIIAARRWMKYGNSEIVEGQTNLQWAEKIYKWMRENRYVPATGRVFENKDKPREDFTYNQGTFLGAALELYNATGNRVYLNDAIRTADHTLDKMVIHGMQGVFVEWVEFADHDHDVNLFKGIFIRYLTQLIMHNDLSQTKRDYYLNFMKHNANFVWYRGSLHTSSILYSAAWFNRPKPNEGFLNSQVSGSTMIEAIAALEKKNYLK